MGPEDAVFPEHICVSAQSICSSGFHICLKGFQHTESQI